MEAVAPSRTQQAHWKNKQQQQLAGSGVVVVVTIIVVVAITLFVTPLRSLIV